MLSIGKVNLCAACGLSVLHKSRLAAERLQIFAVSIMSGDRFSNRVMYRRNCLWAPAHSELRNSEMS